MQETLEQRFGLDGARVMESQSEMLFKARREVCELHQQLEESFARQNDLNLQVISARRKVMELEECFAYIFKMFDYACKKQHIIIGVEELEENLGERPPHFNDYMVNLRQLI